MICLSHKHAQIPRVRGTRDVGLIVVIAPCIVSSSSRSHTHSPVLSLKLRFCDPYKPVAILGFSCAFVEEQPTQSEYLSHGVT